MGEVSLRSANILARFSPQVQARFLSACRGKYPIHDMARIIVQNPQHRGVLLAALAMQLAKEGKPYSKILRLAREHSLDDYWGLIYVKWVETTLRL